MPAWATRTAARPRGYPSARRMPRARNEIDLACGMRQPGERGIPSPGSSEALSFPAPNGRVVLLTVWCLGHASHHSSLTPGNGLGQDKISAHVLSPP